MDPSENIVQKMLMAAPDALLAVNADGEIVFANTHAEFLFGWSAEEMVGEQVELLVPGVAVEVQVTPRTGSVTHPRTHPFGSGLRLMARRKGGDTFPVEVSLTEVSDDPAERVILAAVRDVSDRIELEAEQQRQALLARQERSARLESLGQLARGVAHDFNNTLGVVLNYATLLSRRITDPMGEADLQEIRSAAEQARELTRQLASFAGRGMANLQSLDVNAVVRETASMLDGTFDENIDVRLDLAPGPLIALADRRQLEQLIVDLASNASDAMPAGGHLTIATAVRQHSSPNDDGGQLCLDVVLRVIDDGIGMTPMVLRRAFEPFFTTKPRGQSAGLGLASAYGIVHQGGGHITIDSTDGAGTTVTVVLSGTEGIAEPLASKIESSPGGGHRILLVGDEATARTGTERMLGEEGYDPLTSATRIEALEIIDRDASAIDLVVTDVVMHQMGGSASAKEPSGRRPDLPVVPVSACD